MSAEASTPGATFNSKALIGSVRKAFVFGCMFPGLVVALLGAISLVGALLGHTQYVGGSLGVVLIGTWIASPAILLLLVLLLIDLLTTTPTSAVPRVGHQNGVRPPESLIDPSAGSNRRSKSLLVRVSVILFSVAAGVLLVFAILELPVGHWLPGISLALLGCLFTALAVAISRSSS